MEDTPTVGDLLSVAIKAERNAEALYHRIGNLFLEYTEVARFWSRYADEEAGHARWLEHLRLRTPPEKLKEPVAMDMWVQAMVLNSVSLDALISRVHTLQDAWDLANELEHGETNTVFEFLISYFQGDPYTSGFLRTQLRDHLGHLLADFPMNYQSILAVKAN